MKLYLLQNGVNVKIMAIDGPSVTPAEFLRASAKLRTFFSRGTREVISEVTIRTEAAETIGNAIVAFDSASVPLHVALSELLDFCRGQMGRDLGFADPARLPGLPSSGLLSEHS